MKARTHNDFLKLVRDRIRKGAFDELFAAGCCFHFALRAHDKKLGAIASIPSSNDPTKAGHVLIITADGVPSTIKAIGRWRL
jgi:hypothetical protein